MAKWRDEFYVKAYRLARDGFTDYKIRRSLDVSQMTFDRWLKNRPEFAKAIQEGRKRDTSNVETFQNYVHGRLPPTAKKLWQELLDAERESTEGGSDERQQQAVEMITTQGRKIRQQVFLHALICSNFQTTIACRRTGVSVSEVRAWAAKERGFAQLIKGIHQCKKDFFEGALVELVAKGDSAAVIFVNKTVNKDRGYGEHKDDTTKRVQHEHRLILDDIPIEARKAVLESIRRKQALLEDRSDIIDAEVEVRK